MAVCNQQAPGELESARECESAGEASPFPCSKEVLLRRVASGGLHEEADTGEKSPRPFDREDDRSGIPVETPMHRGEICEPDLVLTAWIRIYLTGIYDGPWNCMNLHK